MDENKIRKIVQQEIAKSAKANRFGLHNIPNHHHNGNDSPKVKSGDIDTNPGVMGTVLFATAGVDYIFQLNMPQTPKRVTLNGTFVNSVTHLAPITNRYHVWGEAYLGRASYLQPVDNRTVAVGGIEYPALDNLRDGSIATIPVQSSKFFGFINGAGQATAGGSQFHIADVFGSAILRMTLVDFSKDRLVFRVTDMSAGYSLSANFLIT